MTNSLRWGYVDPRGHWIVTPRFFSAGTFKDGLAFARPFGSFRFGVINRQGEMLIEPRFDHVRFPKEGLRAVNEGGQRDANGVIRGGRWGFVDNTGALAIDLRFDNITDFSCGIAAVAVGDRWGWIDREGRFVVEPTYDFTDMACEERAVFAEGDLEGYVDPTGRVVIPAAFQRAGDFVGGVAPVRKGDRWLLINLAGDPITSNTYGAIGSCQAGSYAVQEGEQWWVLNAEGQPLGGRAFLEVGPGEGGLRPVRVEDGWALLQPDGTLSQSVYQRVLTPTEGLARVSLNGESWGFAGANGELVIDPVYRDAYAFQQGRAAVKGPEGWGFIDAQGQPHGPHHYDVVSSFSEERATVRRQGRMGFVNLEGEMAVELGFNAAESFSEGQAAAMCLEPAMPPPSLWSACHTIPHQGLQHAVFDAMGPEDSLSCTVGFSAQLTPQQDTLFLQTLLNWEVAARRVEGEKLYVERRWSCPENMYLRVVNLYEPRQEMGALLAELHRLELPLQEIILSRWVQQEEGGVWGPMVDPAMPPVRHNFADFPEFFQWVMSGQEPVAAPENAYYLKGMVPKGGNGMFLEERGMPIYIPGLTVAMGVAENMGEEVLPPDERTQQVADAVADALEQRLARVWHRPSIDPPAPPLPEDRQGLAPAADKIQYAGRIGYVFGLDCRALVHYMSDARVRWREPEVMEAVHTVVRELNLEPVVLWQRFGQEVPMMPMRVPDIMVIQLWERAS